MTERPQPGACLHCHASVIPTYRRLGAGDVMAGFAALGRLPYAEAHAEVVKTGSQNPVALGDTQGFAHADRRAPGRVHGLPRARDDAPARHAPGFRVGIAELAKSDAPVPHLPSIERWREGDRAAPFDPDRDASRQEMRSFVCGAVPRRVLLRPEDDALLSRGRKGLRVEQIEAYYDEFRFDDGTTFYDWEHAETGAHVLKAQHPEFETWSQGIHARAAWPAPTATCRTSARARSR